MGRGSMCTCAETRMYISLSTVVASLRNWMRRGEVERQYDVSANAYVAADFSI
jgi:hypothetical protein